MKDNLEVQEAKFRSFLNKRIIGASKDYYKKQMKYEQNELRIMDDENFSSYLLAFTRQNDVLPYDFLFDELENNNVYKSLSDIEKTVIFLYFEREYKTDEIANLLNIHSESVRRIRRRAINKIKNNMKEGNRND